MPCFKTKKAKYQARLEEEAESGGRGNGHADVKSDVTTTQPAHHEDVHLNVKRESPVQRLHQLIPHLQRKLQELNTDKQTSQQHGRQLKSLYNSLALADKQLREAKPTSKKFGACVKQLADVTTQLEQLSSKVRPAASVQPPRAGQPTQPPRAAQPTQSQPAHTGTVTNRSLADFDQLISGSVQRLVDCSHVIGGDLAQQADAVREAFVQQLIYLRLTAECQQPDQPTVVRLLSSTSHYIGRVQSMSGRSKQRELTNHLKTMSESVAALGWVTVSPTPGPHVKEMTEAGQYWLNRVLKEHKSKEQHKNWCDAWRVVFSELHGFVREHYTTGLTWNPQGRSVTEADIPNISEETAVDKPKSSKKSAKTADVREKKPVHELQGKRWMIERHKDNAELVVSGTKPSQSVYIYSCERCTVQVKGKVNSIVLDTCKRVGVVFSDVISCVEFVNCQSVQGQVTGSCPTMSVEKTDGCQLYLTKSRDTEIISAKSSAVNVLTPNKHGDFSEHAVPEQFRSTFNVKTRKLHTAPKEVTA